MRDIFVKCFYVWTEIGPRTLSLTFFRSRIGMDFHFKILDHRLLSMIGLDSDWKKSQSAHLYRAYRWFGA